MQVLIQFLSTKIRCCITEDALYITQTYLSVQMFYFQVQTGTYFGCLGSKTAHSSAQEEDDMFPAPIESANLVKKQGHLVPLVFPSPTVSLIIDFPITKEQRSSIDGLTNKGNGQGLNCM
jgi:hypothetical protein